MPTSFTADFLTELDAELAGTRRILERVPYAQADYKPHPKSMSLWQLASHVVNLLAFKTLFVQANGRDFLDPNAPKPGPTTTSHAELMARFEEYSAALRQALADTDDAQLGQNFRLHRGEHTIFERPKSVALRLMGLNHSIHHRGQLSVYLRLLDIPVPGLYGPSADEQGGAV